MNIKQIKNKLINWIDFYGGDIPDKEAIIKAKTEDELSDILDRHERLLEETLEDAKMHLDLFRKDLGL